MINRVSNSIDYPRKINSGLHLKYIFDIDFMDLDILIPSVRDFGNDGGVIAARTSLYISHNFPLTLIYHGFYPFFFYGAKEAFLRSIDGLRTIQSMLT